MMIAQTTLDDVFELYKLECRYLKEAELLFPEIEGKFSIARSHYLVEDSGHFNAVDLIICYNQLAYAFFVESSKQNLIPSLPHFVETDKLRKDSLIVRMNNIRFRKPINSKEFHGRLKLKETVSKRDNNLYFFKTEYDFEDGKATGEIDLAFILSQPQLH